MGHVSAQTKRSQKRKKGKAQFLRLVVIIHRLRRIATDEVPEQKVTVIDAHYQRSGIT